ncbi:MAG: TerC family protein [Alphaproteobacteria bacterium]
MIADFSNPSMWMSLLILTALEIVLGIDNIIFLAIASARLPKHRQALARKIGLGLALAGRIIFLLSITWIMKLEEPVAAFGDFELSWRDIIFIVGGGFLIYKATGEIHSVVEGQEEEKSGTKKHATFTRVIIQIGLLDIVFALDSMITAVGLSQHLWVMITANVIAMFVMLFAADAVSRFIAVYPTVRMLALTFLMMVGLSLLADGLHKPIPKEYIYAAIAFSSVTEFLNVVTKRKAEKKKSPKA